MSIEKDLVISNKVVELLSSEILDGLTIQDIEQLFSQSLSRILNSTIIDRKSELFVTELNKAIADNKELSSSIVIYK
jgi:hypothetical protein